MEEKITGQHPRRKYYIIGGGILMIGGVIYLALENAREKKIIAKIKQVLEAGNFSNLENVKKYEQFKSAFNKDYWKTSGSSNLLTNQQVIAFATKIYNSIGIAYDDETAIVNIFANQLKNKAQLSQVSDYFQKKFSRDLFDFITYHVDKGTNSRDIFIAVPKLASR